MLRPNTRSTRHKKLFCPTRLLDVSPYKNIVFFLYLCTQVKTKRSEIARTDLLCRMRIIFHYLVFHKLQLLAPISSASSIPQTPTALLSTTSKLLAKNSNCSS